MVHNTEKYTVITGASSGIGYETAKAFAGRGSNLILVARRKDRLEALNQEILSCYPALNIIIKATDLSISDNVFRLYEEIKGYPLQTWINNAGFGNYDTVSHQDLNKIRQMLHLNVEALTVLSSLFVRDFKDVEGTQLINISSAGGYTIVPALPKSVPSKLHSLSRDLPFLSSSSSPAQPGTQRLSPYRYGIPPQRSDSRPKPHSPP